MFGLRVGLSTAARVCLSTSRQEFPHQASNVLICCLSSVSHEFAARTASCQLATCSAASSLWRDTHLFNQTRGFFNPVASTVTAKHYQERKLLGYSPEQMYSIVAAVEHYKEFVPFCVRSEIVSDKRPTFLEAELEVGFKIFTERYTSQVNLDEPRKVTSRVAASTLFKHMENVWEFKQGPTPGTCWLTFFVDFAFKSPLYRHVATVFFDEVVRQMMKAFESRAQHLYGPSVLQPLRTARLKQRQPAPQLNTVS